MGETWLLLITVHLQFDGAVSAGLRLAPFPVLLATILNARDARTNLGRRASPLAREERVDHWRRAERAL